MTRLRIAALLGLACVSMMMQSACGGGNSSQITITLNTANGILSVDESESLPAPAGQPNIIAAVGGDTAGKGVTWSFEKQTGCSGAGSGVGSCGTLSNNAAFGVTYTAPAINSTTSVVITATSAADTKVTKTITLSVVLPPVFATTECNPAGVLPCTLANGNNAIPYSQNFTFTGGVQPYAFTLLGTLPKCLNLNTSSNSTTGTIVGTPCGSGKADFQIQITDNGGAPAVMQEFIITVAPPPPLALPSAPLPPGTVDATYNGSIGAQGGVTPLTFSVTAGALPPGLSLNSATGLITGVPSDQSGGNANFYPKAYNFSVSVHDSALPDPQPAGPTQFSITIQPLQPLQITTQGPSLANGSTAAGYSASLNASGGVTCLSPQPAYAWSVVQGQLPAGLSLSSNANGTATISGTPIIVGTSTFTVEVADCEVNPANGNPAPGTAQATFSIKINAGASSNALFSGTYAFLFNGFDDDGAVQLAGVLSSNGAGVITTGSVDANRLSGVGLGGAIVAPGGATPPGSTYSVGSDGRGTMELTMTFGANSPIVADYDLAFDGGGNIRFFQDYTTAATKDSKHTHGEGILKPVAGIAFSAASFSGNYAFLLPGKEAAGNKRAALVGVVHSDGATLGGTGDFNDNGTYSAQMPLSGSFAFVGGNQGVASLTFAPNGPQVTLDFKVFFVTPSDIFFIEGDSDTNTGLPTMMRLAGEAVLQSTNTQFNQTVMTGSSVASGTGLDSTGNASVFAGLLAASQCDNNTPLSFTYDENDGGTLAARPFSGTCSITSNGRAQFALFVSDTFARANGGVGANWSATEGAFSIANNSVVLSGQGADMRGSMYWSDGGAFSNDQFSQLTITSAGGASSALGPAVRVQASSEGYYTLTAAGSQIALEVQSAGVNTPLGTFNHQVAPGDILRLEVQGTTLTGKLNGATIITANDSSFASGSAGIAALNTTSPSAGNDWSGGNMAAQRVAAAYLTGAAQGFLIGNDAAVTTGQLEQQTITSFSLASFSDGYTLSTPFIAEAGVNNVIGQTTANGANALAGVVDEIDATGAASPNLAQPLSATFTNPAPNGRGTLVTNGTKPSGFPMDSVFYVVSGGSVRIVSEDTSDTHPQLILLDH